MRASTLELFESDRAGIGLLSSDPVRMSEELVQERVCSHLKHEYPNTVFYSSANGIRIGSKFSKSGWKLRKQISNNNTKDSPDLFIAEPSCEYNALFIEIKRDFREIFKLDGSLKKSQHLEDQLEVIKRLRLKGYCAGFGCGVKHCLDIYRAYIELDK